MHLSKRHFPVYPIPVPVMAGLGGLLIIFFMGCKSYERPEPNYPNVVEDTTGTSKNLYYIDNILDGLAQGRIVFNIPNSIMEVGQSSTIQLLLDLAKPVEELEKMITESGVVESHEIKVSEIMEARLTGAGFQITAITPEEQPISTQATTEWKWDIKAMEKGPQRLHLTLSAIIRLQGQKLTRSLRTFDKVIEVKVSWGKRISSFIGKNWQWLWAALIIPAVSWLWKRRQNAKKRRR